MEKVISEKLVRLVDIRVIDFTDYISVDGVIVKCRNLEPKNSDLYNFILEIRDDVLYYKITKEFSTKIYLPYLSNMTSNVHIEFVDGPFMI